MEPISENILKNLHKTGFARYTSENTVVCTKENSKEEVKFDDFLEKPDNYVELVNLNMFFLFLNLVDEKNYPNIQKMIDKKILNSQYYDSIINQILSNKQEEYDLEIIKMLYEEISIELREFTVANCLSSDNDKIIDWAFENLDKEEYLDVEKIFHMVTSINEKVFNKVLQMNLFETLLNILFNLMFLKENLVDLFLKEYINRFGNDYLSNVNEDNKIATLLYCIMTDNLYICKKFLENTKLSDENLFSWLPVSLMREKYIMIDFILSNSNITRINEKMTNACLVMCGEKINENTLKFLLLNKDKFENLDLTSNDHAIIRNAIINDKIEIVKILLENKVYTNKSDVESSELLNDTIEFFASEEITNLINNYLE
jgi:hypothetical protein